MCADYNTLTDEQLVIEFKSGDERAFDILYARYADRLWKMIYGYTRDQDDAVDVLHDVFIRVYVHIGSFKTDRTFSSWIYRIAINCAKNYLKTRHKRMVLAEKEKQRVALSDEEESPEERILKNEDLQYFSEAVDSLKDKFKTVFLMRFTERKQYADIAQVLGISERTAKWRMQKSIELIIDYLKDRGVV